VTPQARPAKPRARPVKLGVLAAALLISLLPAGCGTAAPTRLTGGRLTVTLGEYSIAPSAVSVPAGPLEIVARNRGILVHNVAVERGSLDSSERTILAATPTPLLPGATGSFRTAPLSPGRYLLASTIGNQAVLGMAATLIVR
jgi:hypothetical protein